VAKIESSTEGSLCSAAQREKATELSKHQARMLEHVAIGVAPELIAAGVCFPLATAVLLPSGRNRW